jgi:hypothetical protein
MRHLLQPRVLQNAVVASLASAAVSYPRLVLWFTRPAPVWYLEATIFICGIILWGFVFAWHPPYTGRPVLTTRIEPKPFITATLLAVFLAVFYALILDPYLRTKLPDEYPPDVNHWLAYVGFALGFNQLFLIFAPCDWSLRLVKRPWLAIVMTAIFGVCVHALNISAQHVDIAPLLLAALLACRFVMGALLVWFYLRGGLLFAWWWTLVLESRHLIQLMGGN